MIDFKKLEELLAKYPRLSLVLLSGVVSWRVAKNLLGITTAEMTHIYVTLLEARAVKGVSSSNFRAVPEVIEYLKDKEKEKQEESNNDT